MHLTNVAVQKTGPGCVPRHGAVPSVASVHGAECRYRYDAGAGCKWPLRQLKLCVTRSNRSGAVSHHSCIIVRTRHRYLIGKFGLPATDRLFFEIQELLIYSLLAVQKIMIHDKHCFEMYG